MKAALVISDRDNVATALEVLEAGRALDLGGHHLVVQERIASGHKVALVPIASGQAVIKYGSPIGTATSDIAAGAHVHTHNVASARGRGDLGRTVEHEPGVRLAEPEDEAAEMPSDLAAPGGSHE